MTAANDPSEDAEHSELCRAVGQDAELRKLANVIGEPGVVASTGRISYAAVARKLGCTIYRARQLIAQAKRRLEAHNPSDTDRAPEVRQQ